MRFGCDLDSESSASAPERQKSVVAGVRHARLRAFDGRIAVFEGASAYRDACCLAIESLFHRRICLTAHDIRDVAMYRPLASPGALSVVAAWPRVAALLFDMDRHVSAMPICFCCAQTMGI